MSVRLPRLQAASPIVDDRQQPTQAFQRYWQNFAETIERAINSIATILGITDQLDQALQQAQVAIATAQAAADTAQMAADAATAETAAQKRESALQASYIDPSSVLSADPTTISIAGHTRRYGDGTSVAVSAGTVTATAAGEEDYVYYDDPTRVGGAVAYQVSTTLPVQTGDRHVVGAVLIPATGTQDGGDGPRPPGFVQVKMPDA
jgi:hypothetical protein